MKCAFVKTAGPAHSLTVGELPDPTIGQKQVLVRIRYSAVNPIDTYIRAGTIPMPVQFPYIPGCDFAGEVVATGPGVTRFHVGDRVWGSNQGLFNRQGTLAELAAIDEHWVYLTPESMTDAEAAAGALTGITAHLGLFRDAQLKAGEWVFVNGGTGGVGSVVTQFAKAAGAHVITTSGSEEKCQASLQLGADVALNYRDANLDQLIREATAANGGLDIFWETQRIPDISRAVSLMKKRGRIIVMAGRDAELKFVLGPFYVNDLKLLGFAMFNAAPEEQQICAEQMNKWFEQKKWKPVIGREFPLSQAGDAHLLQEENTIGQKSVVSGKILVAIDG